MANIPISSFTAAANATGIGMSGFSLTGSNAQSMLDLAGTWNTSGTPAAINLNVTDTASNAASLLMNLRVGGTSQFSLNKIGFGLFANSIGLGNGVASGANAGQFTISGANNAYISVGGAGHFRFVGASSTDIFSLLYFGPSAQLPSSGLLGWTNSANTQGTVDVSLYRDAANTLAQRNGVNAQTFRVYNTFTDASNYERGGFLWSGNRLVVGTSNAGTGTSRSLDLVGADLNFKTGTQESNSNRWVINSSGNFIAATDNVFDIGQNAANRPRDIFSSRDVYAQSNISGFYLGAFADVALLRDDPNILAQRRSTNPQTFRVYNTFTDASNYERGVMAWSSNILLIGTERAGTGSTRSVQVVAGPTSYFFNADEVAVFPATGALQFNGRFRFASPALGIVRLTEHNGANAGALELPEWAAAPAAPAANNVRIYAEDNGSGKTRLMARFATGAAVQIAIEP